MGVAAAYARRLQTGEGQKVDTSLFEAAITHTYWQSAIAFATGNSPGPMGSAHPLNAPYQAFETSDGWINIGAANQANWERLIALLEVPELNQDSSFATNNARMENLDALTGVLTARFKTKTTETWLAVLETGGFPAGPVLSISDMHADPQARAREMIVETQHPVVGAVETIGLPVKFSATPGGVRQSAPQLGEHGAEVLREYDYSEDEIAKLIATGALGPVFAE